MRLEAGATFGRALWPSVVILIADVGSTVDRLLLVLLPASDAEDGGRDTVGVEKIAESRRLVVTREAGAGVAPAVPRTPRLRLS